MNEVATKRKLLEQANLLVKTNDATTTLVACAALLDALGTLMSDWTGEVVRVQMTAEGKPEMLDMSKRPAPWPIRGARVEGDKVIVAVTGGNDAARRLCGELVAMVAVTPNVLSTTPASSVHKD